MRKVGKNATTGDGDLIRTLFHPRPCGPGAFEGKAQVAVCPDAGRTGSVPVSVPWGVAVSVDVARLRLSGDGPVMERLVLIDACPVRLGPDTGLQGRTFARGVGCVTEGAL